MTTKPFVFLLIGMLFLVASGQSTGTTQAQAISQNSFGDIYIHGTDDMEQVLISMPQNWFMGYLRIELNDELYIFDSVRNITINLYGGRDSVSFGGLNLPGDFVFNGGEGPDVVSFSPADVVHFGGNVLFDLGNGDNDIFCYSYLTSFRVQIDENLTVLCQGGDDEISFPQITHFIVHGQTAIRLGGGANNVIWSRHVDTRLSNLRTQFVNGFYLEAKGGQDSISLNGIISDLYFWVDLGDGMNSLACNNFEMSNIAIYDGGLRTDFVDFSYGTVVGETDISTNEEKDFVYLTECNLDGKTSIETSSGLDTIDCSDSDLHGTVILHSGSDHDHLYITSSLVTAEIQATTARGLDVMAFTDTTFAAKSVFSMGADVDTLEITACTFEELVDISMGSGDDSVQTDSNLFQSDPSFFLDGGIGFDSLFEIGTPERDMSPETYRVESISGY